MNEQQARKTTIQKMVALVTAPVGLIFLLSDEQSLLELIYQFQLNWYTVFQPWAWGIILGALAGLLRLDQVQRLAVWGTWGATALLSFGLVGALATYFEHRLWFLSWPALWLALLGLGVHSFFLMQLRFSQKMNKGNDDAQS